MLERRLFPRFSVEWPIRVSDMQGRFHDAIMSDISLAGVGLTVSRTAAIELAQGGNILTPGDRIRVFFTGAPGAIDRSDWGYECRIKEVRRLAQDSYLVGAWFAAMPEDREQALKAVVGLAGR